jgi:tRNA A37 threonylcarbamoyladenosine dehydratase
MAGAETTAKLTQMKVLIVGLRGVGMETAKNLALQGAGAITVCAGLVVALTLALAVALALVVVLVLESRCCRPRCCVV